MFLNCREMKYVYFLYIFYIFIYLCIFSVKKLVIINCCFMVILVICDGYFLIKLVQWSFIYLDINDLDVLFFEDI